MIHSTRGQKSSLKGYEVHSSHNNSTTHFYGICEYYLDIENGNDIKNTCSQQTQTPTRGVQYYQSIPTFYPTPLTSGTDIMYDSNYDYRNTASTPLLPYVHKNKIQTKSFIFVC